jgi:hypothetical protein
MPRRQPHSVSASAILYGDLPRRQRASEESTGAAPAAARIWGRGPLGEEVGAAHSYVVVEEVDDGNVTLVVAPWPEVDPEGCGLSFAPEEDRAAAVADRASLQAALRERTTLLEYGERAEPDLAEREIAAGDVFAIELAGELPADGDLRDEGAGWIAGPIVDVTALARNVAKAAMLAALTGKPLAEDEAAKIAASAEEPGSQELGPAEAGPAGAAG